MQTNLLSKEWWHNAFKGFAFIQKDPNVKTVSEHSVLTSRRNTLLIFQHMTPLINTPTGRPRVYNKTHFSLSNSSRPFHNNKCSVPFSCHLWQEKKGTEPLQKLKQLMLLSSGISVALTLSQKELKMSFFLS